MVLGVDVMPDRCSRQTGISGLVADFTKVPSFEAPDTPQSTEERERRERIIQSLDRRVPHGLGEDFRYKRPAVLTLDGVSFTSASPWTSLRFSGFWLPSSEIGQVFRNLPATALPVGWGELANPNKQALT